MLVIIVGIIIISTLYSLGAAVTLHATISRAEIQEIKIVIKIITIKSYRTN